MQKQASNIPGEVCVCVWDKEISPFLPAGI